VRNWLIYILILTGTTSVLAQRISGELRIQVTDPTGAALRANGNITGEATGVSRVFETDEQGRFVIRGLPPGTYTLIIRSEGFAEKTVPLQIVSELPLDQRITLEVTPISTTVEVKDEPLANPALTAQYVPRQELEDRLSAAANRSVIDLVNAQPGWILEANGSLHPRGSEYDVQFVVDGVPLYDNRSPAFGQSVNVEEFESLNIRTAGYPAEFGLKLGGVIETASNQDMRAGLHGSASLQEGSFNNRDAFMSLIYSRNRTAAGFSGEALATDR
jgi:hypothetical protein